MRKIVQAEIIEDSIITEDSDPAREFYAKNGFGKINKGKVVLSFFEAAYLIEADKLKIKKYPTMEKFIKMASRKQKNFSTNYSVFKDLRSRGYIVKTALKFGAEFRVYDKGIKPGEDHAKWVVYPVNETRSLTWHEFSAKNRVAHSTKKRLLIGIVDSEQDVTYYEIKWMRP